MSMIAKFVQVQPGRLAELLEDPDSVELLFENGAPIAASLGVFMKMSETVRERVQRLGPQMLAGTLERMDPQTREALSKRLESMGVDPAALAKGEGGEALFKAMEQRREALSKLMEQRSAMAHRFAAAGGTKRSNVISLDKAWHGVHYLLCGKAEPGTSLLSQAVMGGTEIGDDFSGYGPARYFDAAGATRIAAELTRANLESELSARFDAAEMTRLGIYPGGWSQSGSGWLMEAYRALRDFYSGAASQSAAVVTAIV